jgi:hypothetical protein
MACEDARGTGRRGVTLIGKEFFFRLSCVPNGKLITFYRQFEVLL